MLFVRSADQVLFIFLKKCLHGELQYDILIHVVSTNVDLDNLHGPLVKGLRHLPFTEVTGVRIPYGSPFFEPLAQLVEHLTFNQGVEGSSPSWLTTF